MHTLSKFLHFTITVPLMALPFAVGVPKFASAEISSPGQALQQLAKTREIDSKCKALSASERQELNDYVARAELAVARRNSVADAQAAITIGKSRGSSVSCDATSTSEVRDTLTAARRAVASLPAQQVEDNSGLIIEDQARPSMRSSLIDQTTPPAEPKIRKTLVKTATGQPQSGKGLKRYRAEAAAYYVERRCGHLSHRETVEFWNRIVERHNQALATSSRKAVAAALKSAMADANARSCGLQTAQMVRQGFAAVQTP